MKSLLKVEHVPTGRTWGSTPKEITQEEYELLMDFLRRVSTEGKYFTLETEEGGMIITENIIKDCTFLVTDA